MLGTAQIEDDRGVILGVALEPGFLAIGFPIDHIPRFVQRCAHVSRDTLVVLHEQDAHQSPLLTILPV